jgi:hypothetical protein
VLSVRTIPQRDRHGRIRVPKGSDHGLGMCQVPTDREKSTKRVWERLIVTPLDGEGHLSEFVYLPATAQFSLTTLALWPRVSHVEGMRPFNFLTIRCLDPAALPDGDETFELLSYHSPKDPEWMGLAEKDGAKNWAHILEAFARHRDRKYLLGTDRRFVRRHVVVQRSSLAGLGKEGTKLSARFKLGQIAGRTPSVFVDWKRRLLAMGRAEAKALGLPYRRVCEWKAKLRAGTLPTNGAVVRRLTRALLAG